MPIATLTSKGQTTIPLEIRNFLGLHSGDKLEFFIDSDGHVLVQPLTVDVRSLKGFLPKSNKAVSIEQMNEVITKRAAQ